MEFDSGEVLPGLNESWTFIGANAMEWAVGIVVFLLIGSFGNPGRSMPYMIMGWLFTTTSLASMRRSFPDEERGVRNAIMTACGFPPPEIPCPASLQPTWSGRAVKELPEKSKFRTLSLDRLFPSFERELEDVEE